MRLRRAAAALVATLTGGLVVGGMSAPPTAAAPVAPTAAEAADEDHSADDDHWFTAWTQSIQRRSGLTFTNRTLRQVSRLTQGGDKIRLRLENSFGNAPMTVDQTTVGLAGTGAAVVPGSLETVTFDGDAGITIPAGGMVWSDPLDYAVEAQDDLVVSFYLQNATVTTLHDRAGRTNWFAPNGGGNHTMSESAAPFNEAHGWSYIVGAIDVHNEDLAGTVVTYGSSVVDGNGSESCGPGCSEPNPYMRWTDIVSRRIRSELPADSQLAIVNAGIAGTTASPACGSGGIDGVSRLSRDVLQLSGVTALIYYYGTNDVANLNNGSGCSAEALVSSMRATFAELRAAGIDVFVTPVTPRPGYTFFQNQRRSEINAFIRDGGDCSGTCDGIVDFDAALRDPGNPNIIRPAYDLDGLHVNTLGQQALADAVALEPLVEAGAPSFTSPAPEAASLDEAYSYQLAATGRPAPSYSIVDGALPEGLSLDPVTGVISGVPTEAGASSFTVEARNAAGADELEVVLDVLAGPVFTNGEPPAGNVGVPYEFTLEASGHPAPTYAVTGGELPAGLRLDGDTGRISGIPTAAGSFPVTVEASNGAGTDITTSFTLSVASAVSATVATLADTKVRYGTRTTVRATVVSSSAAAPTGTVELRAGSTPVGSASLAPDDRVPGMSVATITVAPRALKPGVHPLTVDYAGDAGMEASDDTARLTVDRALAKVKAALKPRKLTTATRGRLVVTVRSPGVTAPGGKVVVSDGGRRVGVAKVAANGKATVRLARLRAGKHTLEVTHRGSAIVEPGAATKVRVRVRRR